MWNFKGTLWNSPQNIILIHWKIWFLYNIEILRALRFKSWYMFLKRPPDHGDTVPAMPIVPALFCLVVCYRQFTHILHNDFIQLPQCHSSTPTLKRKGRQDDCPHRHWRGLMQASTSPAMTRAVILMTFSNSVKDYISVNVCHESPYTAIISTHSTIHIAYCMGYTVYDNIDSGSMF